MNKAEAMRRDWDDRARKNAFHYIASLRGGKNGTSTLSLRRAKKTISGLLIQCLSVVEFQPLVKSWRNSAAARGE